MHSSCKNFEEKIELPDSASGPKILYMFSEHRLRQLAQIKDR
jgi:hypothetical protein